MYGLLSAMVVFFLVGLEGGGVGVVVAGQRWNQLGTGSR